MNQIKLAALAEAAISSCVKDASNVKGTGEIAEVARLVLGFPARLAGAWGTELETGSIEVRGVFCHSTPQAYWNDPTSKLVPPPQKHPELCDLLIVLDDCPATGGRQRRALLLQAKTGAGGKFTVGSHGPSIQRYMFANWDTLDLVGTPLPDLKKVSLAPTVPGQCPGSRYALVDTSAKKWSLEAAQAAPIVPFKNFKEYAGTKLAPLDFGGALTSMLEGTSGSPCHGDWGRLVNYLLKLADARIANAKQPAGVKSTTPGVCLSHSACASTFVNSAPIAPAAQTSFMSSRQKLPWGEDIRRRSTLRSNEKFEPSEGFGILHITVKASRWKAGG